MPIYGTHFDVYAKMFNELALPKKCAIIADGDLTPSDAQREDGDEDELPEVPDLAGWEANMSNISVQHNLRTRLDY